MSGDSFVLRSNKDYPSLDEYEKEIPEFLEELSKFSAYIEDADDYVEFDVTIGISFEKQNSLEKAEIALKCKYKIGNRLIFEIVESEDIDNYEAVQLFVEEVKALGVRIAIDDFGSGFSNYKRIFDICYELGVDEFQGYYFSEPICEKALLESLVPA